MSAPETPTGPSVPPQGSRPYPDRPPYPAHPPYGWAGQPVPGAVPPAAAAPAPPAAGQQPPMGGPVPPAYAYGAPAQPVGPPTVPPRRSGRAWMWWLGGILVALVVFGCAIASVASLVGGGKSTSALGGNTIAVIPMAGTIAGTGAAPSVMTPDNFLKLIQRAEDDDSVKAIVLRVNSPGGTVAASEEIATYVKQATKPVVVSVGDVDASGAYMVSSQADAIVANPGSAVGSIGVITEIPNVAGLLDKLGVQFKVITAGKYKDAGSPYRSLTSTETALIQGDVDQVYGQFIDIVASGRHLPRSQVESMATGWAWNAVQAKQLGLVDQIGTYKDALDKAAKLGHIQGAYQTDVYDESQFSSIVSSLLGIETQLSRLNASNPTDPASLGGSTLAK